MKERRPKRPGEKTG